MTFDPDYSHEDLRQEYQRDMDAFIECGHDTLTLLLAFAKALYKDQTGQMHLPAARRDYIAWEDLQDWQPAGLAVGGLRHGGSRDPVTCRARA